jgi:hypothetical protein
VSNATGHGIPASEVMLAKIMAPSMTSSPWAKLKTFVGR